MQIANKKQHNTHTRNVYSKNLDHICANILEHCNGAEQNRATFFTQ